MARDFYAWFPLDLPSLPSVRRLRRRLGPCAVLMYYELRVMAATSYQYGQSTEVADVLGQCADWGMDEGQAAACLEAMADARLIDPEALEAGFIGIDDVAERALFVRKKSEAGREGGKTSGKSRSKASAEAADEASA